MPRQRTVRDPELPIDIGKLRECVFMYVCMLCMCFVWGEMAGGGGAESS